MPNYLKHYNQLCSTRKLLARINALECSQTTKDNISNKFKVRINLQNSIKSICPHCMLKGQFVAMKRWHFDNCKIIKEI